MGNVECLSSASFAITFNTRTATTTTEFDVKQTKLKAYFFTVSPRPHSPPQKKLNSITINNISFVLGCAPLIVSQLRPSKIVRALRIFISANFSYLPMPCQSTHYHFYRAGSGRASEREAERERGERQRSIPFLSANYLLN